MRNDRPVNQLRGRRAALGLSQAEVAAHMGRDQSWYSLIENGHYEPTPDEMAKLAECLGCAVSDIFPDRAA